MTAAVDHLLNLIRIPSVSSTSNLAVIEYAEKFLQSKKWQTRRLSYRDSSGTEKVNLIAAPPNQDVARNDVDLAFFCHTDTVPFAVDWTKALDPFIENENLHGCGACDVKGFLACLLAATDQVESNAFADGLRIVLTADEEIGCIGAAHLIAANALKPARAIIGEPTSLHVARAGKGYCLAKVTVHGKEAHSAHPASGASAILATARLISSIEELSKELASDRHNFFDPPFTTLNVGTIQGGTAKNIVPGRCEFLVEWRPIPSQPANKALDGIGEIIAGMRRGDSRFEYQVTTLRQQSGFETLANAPLVSQIADFTGRSETSIPFGSEASLLSTIAKEVVVIGPGDMRSAHSDREYVPIPELDLTVRLMAELMRRG
ncbi:acetylornithine deacetylase [Alloacidobacterium dinghuense]|uniref:Acetylornithine deacetylase n=1 Tax=Alloacidobacterium dinghuense TaxID=2763107 RepID=A0A7G8BKV1_9BACT|nr:acetylornithine deacetylase [Alloacidobacterium dinghuense]QNI33171.1 acetylornithine deacetylase [Alloacidobacterium dinghuense]